jgi:hypothetical protein
MNTEIATAESIGDDLLRGRRAIAAFTGETDRRVDYLLRQGQIPAGQIGRMWVASKKTLREHYARVVTGKAA